MPTKSTRKPRARHRKSYVERHKPRGKATSKAKPRMPKASKPAKAQKVPAHLRALEGVDPRRLPPGTLYPCNDPWVGVQIRGDKLQGRVLGCVSPQPGVRHHDYAVGRVAGAKMINRELRGMAKAPKLGYGPGALEAARRKPFGAGSVEPPRRKPLGYGPGSIESARRKPFGAGAVESPRRKPLGYGAGTPEVGRPKAPAVAEGPPLPEGTIAYDAAKPRARPITIDWQSDRGFVALMDSGTLFSRIANATVQEHLKGFRWSTAKSMTRGWLPWATKDVKAAADAIHMFGKSIQITRAAAAALFSGGIVEPWMQGKGLGIDARRDGKGFLVVGNVETWRSALIRAGFRDGRGGVFADTIAPVNALLESNLGASVGVSPAVAEALAAFRRSIADSKVSTGESCSKLLAPPGKEYLPFQCAGIAYAMQRRNTLIGDEPGLGKTIQALGYVNNRPDVTSVLVVAPASLLLNWRREAMRWLMRPFRIFVVEESATSVPKDADFVIVNYEKLIETAGKNARSSPVFAELMQRRWSLLVIDEVHKVKYSGSKPQKTSVACFGEYNFRGERTREGLSQRADNRIYLSGTPMPNRSIELWPIVHDLAPQIFNNFVDFGVRFADGHETGYGWKFDGNTNSAELHDILRGSCMVRRLKRDVLKDLPSKTRQMVLLPESVLKEAGLVDQRILDLINEYNAEAAESRERMSRAILAEDRAALAAAARELHLIFDRPEFKDMAEAREAIAAAKVPYVVGHVADMLNNGVEAVVVMAHHKKVQDKLVAEIDKRFGRGTAVLHRGGMSHRARDQSVMDFQGYIDDNGREVPPKPGVRVFVGSILASGVGITLTRANHLVFAEIDWVPGNMNQAEDRVHRIGQKRPVLIQHMIVPGSLDAIMVRRIVAKQAAADSVLDDEHDALQLAMLAPREQLQQVLDTIAPAGTGFRLAENAEEEWAIEACLEYARTGQSAIPLDSYDEAVVADVVKWAAYGLSEAKMRAAVAVAMKIVGHAGLARSNEMRGPRNEVEAWSVGAIQSLIAMDNDHAAVINDVGFSKSDSTIGHALGARMMVGAMTDEHWRRAVHIARRYHRQVGRPPSGDVSRENGVRRIRFPKAARHLAPSKRVERSRRR